MTLRYKILLLGLFAITGMFLALSLQYGVYATQSRSMEEVAPNVRVVGVFSQALHKLQIERGLTSIGHARANGQASGDPFRDTDQLLSGLPAAQGSVVGLRQTLARVRAGAATGTLAPLAVLDSYNGLLQTVIDEMSRLTREFNTAFATTDISALTHLVAAKEYLGQTRATLGYWTANKRDDAAVLNRLVRLKGLRDEELRKFRLEASSELRETFGAQYSGEDVRQVNETVSRIVATGKLPRDLDAGAWWSMATLAIDRLKLIEDSSLGAIEKKAEGELARLRDAMQRGTIATLALALAVLVLAASATVTLIRTLNRLLASMESIAASRDFRRRVPVDTPDEIGRISRTFNKLLDMVQHLLEEKEHAASTDPLTGINNRLRFAEVFGEEAGRKRRTARPMALIMFDIDHFKRINDTHGHGVGDDVLKALARLVGSRIRATDFFGRWGGEEFVLLLRDDDCDAAMIAAEKLRKLIVNSDFGVAGEVRCSFGVAAWRRDDTEASLVARADSALYASKARGRDRVSCPQGEWANCRRRAVCKE